MKTSITALLAILTYQSMRKQKWKLLKGILFGFGLILFLYLISPFIGNFYPPWLLFLVENGFTSSVFCFVIFFFNRNKLKKQS